MRKRVPLGIEFYKEMIEKDYYYVDKTLFIKEILDAGTKVNLFARPRRFGKTLALSTLQTFFEDERDGDKVDNRHCFDGKKIAKCGEEYLEKQGKYPVISLTLKSAKQPDYDMAYKILRNNIAEEFRRHRYVCMEGVLEEDERRRFQDIIGERAEVGNYATALSFLSHCLKKYHGSNVVILIDEYDVPLGNAHFAGFYEQMAAFIRSLFESAFKTNSALEFAIVTGCLRVSKESIFTGLNNLRVVSALNQSYSEYFGFTGEEVREMLSYYGLEDHMDEVKKWYDGYLFGETKIYNPWSILSCMEDNRSQKQFILRPYWANTSSNSIVKELVEKAEKETRAEIERLIAGGTIEKPVHEDITYDDIHKSPDNLWNFLYFTGYLTKAGERFEAREYYLKLVIPNEEIASIYDNMILSWFDNRIKEMDRSAFYRALIAGDCAVIEEKLKQELMKSISFYDAAEQFYHGFMAGMLGGLGEYCLRSNRETGNGRADIMMIPEDEQSPVLIFEFKKVDKFTQMGEGCDEALAQIEEKQYDAEQREEGYRKFIKYGICFCKKSCRVKGAVEGVE